MILCTSESSTRPVSREAGWHCPVLDSRGHLIQVWHIQDAFSGYLACLEKSIPLNCFGKSYSSIITTPVNSPVTCNMHLLLLLANSREQAHSYCDNEGEQLAFLPFLSLDLQDLMEGCIFVFKDNRNSHNMTSKTNFHT